MCNEFQLSYNDVRNNDLDRLTRTDILDKISLLRENLEKTFITNNMIINMQIINLSQELDETIIKYHLFLENREIVRILKI
jgi:hypothetical protein